MLNDEIRPGWGAAYRAREAERAAKFAMPSQQYGAPIRPPEDETGAPERRVFGGGVHTPFRRGAMQPFDPGGRFRGTPYQSEDDYTSLPLVPHPARPVAGPDAYDSFNDGWEGPLNPALSGFFDFLKPDYWNRKFAEAVAHLQALIGKFLQEKKRILDVREMAQRTLALALERNSANPAQVAKLQAIEERAGQLLDQQVDIEGKLQEAKAKVDDVTRSMQESQQLGAIQMVPIAVIAAAISAVGVVAGLVYMHTNQINAVESQLDQVARGVLSADEVAKIKNASGLGLGGAAAAAAGTAAAVGLGALALFWFLRR